MTIQRKTALKLCLAYILAVLVLLIIDRFVTYKTHYGLKDFDPTVSIWGWTSIGLVCWSSGVYGLGFNKWYLKTMGAILTILGLSILIGAIVYIFTPSAAV